jgi:shikimate dehydrogenase
MHKIVGLIGYPLGHSLSPAMQNAAFKKLGLDYEYELFEIKPEDLSEALAGMRALHIAGFNVTVPHKEAVLPLLDEVTQLARVIGAVNTVVNQDGRLIGYNTDGEGFIDSLRQDAKIEPKGKNIVVLGAGGASRAVSVMLAEAKVKTVVISDVIAEKAQDLAAYVDSSFEISCRSAAVGSVELQQAIDGADLLVNTTPLGMHPRVGISPLGNEAKLPKGIVVYDLVYNPAETKLLEQAKEAGARPVSGLGMLVRQGAIAFSIWTGEEAPISLMRQAAEQALRLT